MQRDEKDNEIKQQFKALQTRQIIALTAVMFIVLLVAVLYKRPDLLGELSENRLYSAQIAAIAVFAVFTIYNWRCPSCKKYLGTNIHRNRCRKCGARLQ